jgi:hypothetical protein
LEIKINVESRLRCEIERKVKNVSVELTILNRMDAE